MAVGTLYNLFQGKEELLNFVFLCMLDQENLYKDYDFPISKIKEKYLIDKTIDVYKENTKYFENNLSTLNNNYDLATLLSDLFNIMELHGQYFLIIEKNPEVCGKMFDLYIEYRERLFQNVHKFLSKMMENGEIRQLKYPAYDTKLIIDTIMWWCVHKRYDSFEVEKNYSSQVIKSVVVNALLNAYRNDAKI